MWGGKVQGWVKLSLVYDGVWGHEVEHGVEVGPPVVAEHGVQ